MATATQLAQVTPEGAQDTQKQRWLVKFNSYIKGIIASDCAAKLLKIADDAEAYAACDELKGTEEAEIYIAGVRVARDVRLGQLIPKLKERGELRSAKDNLKRGPKLQTVTSGKTLPEAGIKKAQSYICQQVAKVAKEAPEFIEACLANGERMSSRKIVALYANHKKFERPTLNTNGMPDFKNKKVPSFASFMVHTANEEALANFNKKTGLRATRKSRSIWYPETPPTVGRNAGRYVGTTSTRKRRGKSL